MKTINDIKNELIKRRELFLEKDAAYKNESPKAHAWKLTGALSSNPFVSGCLFGRSSSKVNFVENITSPCNNFCSKLGSIGCLTSVSTMLRILADKDW